LRLGTLRIAEEEGYEALLTTDRNLRYRQNLKERRIAVVVIDSLRLHLVRFKNKNCLY